MPGMMKKTAAPKPTATKKTTPSPKPKVTASAKPKATPTPKFTPPTLGEFKQSAAYKAGEWTYKDYVDYFQGQYNAKYKKK